MRLWKLLGLAGVAGVAATGAVLARDERQRRAYTPDDVRARLRERAAASADAEPGDVEGPTAAQDGLTVIPAATTRLGRLRRRARWQLRHLPVLPSPLRRLDQLVHPLGPRSGKGPDDGPA